MVQSHATRFAVVVTLASCGACWAAELDTDALPNIVQGEFDYAVPNFVKKAYVEKLGTPKPDDVFVASWPKSGTNWVKQIIHLMRIKCDREQLKKEEPVDLSDIVPYLEAQEVDHSTMLKPRVYQTHLTFADIPKGGRIIYVVRELPDIAASFWKYVQQFEGFLQNNTVDEVAKMMMGGMLYYGLWPDHISGYWQARKDPKVLIVRYSDLKKDISAEIGRIAKFLDIGLTPKEAECVQEQSSFKVMKANAHRISGKEWSVRVTGIPVDPTFTLVNEGKSGNAMQFSAEVNDAMKIHGAKVHDIVHTDLAKTAREEL